MLILYQWRVIGVHLLLATQITRAYVLLTANIDDIKRLARKFVSEDIAERIVDFLTKATVNLATNISEENEVNDDTIHEPSKEINILRQNTKTPTKETEKTTQKELKAVTKRTKVKKVTRTDSKIRVFIDPWKEKKHDDHIKTDKHRNENNKKNNQKQSRTKPQTHKSDHIQHAAIDNPKGKKVYKNEPAMHKLPLYEEKRILEVTKDVQEKTANSDKIESGDDIEVIHPKKNEDSESSGSFSSDTNPAPDLETTSSEEEIVKELSIEKDDGKEERLFYHRANMEPIAKPVPSSKPK